MDEHAVEVGPIDVSGVIRDLMDVARVALGRDMEPPSEREAVAVIAALLAVVSERMPEELQAQDARVQAARAVLLMSAVAATSVSSGAVVAIFTDRTVPTVKCQSRPSK